MPEYFEISFLVQKNEIITVVKNSFFNKIGLKEGENQFEDSDFLILCKRAVIFSIFDNEEHNFLEFMIGFPYKLFHRDSFQKDIKPLLDLVDYCFSFGDSIKYALCSYELNGYLLRGINNWQSINKNLLLKFPIIFIKKGMEVEMLNGIELKNSTLFVNRNAQDIF